jgi:hypothetical protein
MTASDERTPLDFAWAQLAAELTAGGATEADLPALRECFYAGAHALVWCLRVHPPSAGTILAGLAQHAVAVEEQVHAATH